MTNRNIPQQGGNGMIMGGGDNSGFAYVSADMLKQVDVPVETLLGAANGALTGGILAAVISGAVSFAQNEGGAGVGKVIAKNWTKGHILPMLVGTTVLTALGGIVRYSRAQKHNEWSERHYNFLEQQNTGHAEKIAAGNGEYPDKGNSR